MCGDNGDGTVTVNGLVWLKDPGCLGYANWDTAMARAKYVAHGQCGLDDESKPGDWRLPTVDELKAIYPSKSQFRNVQALYHWSSSTYAGGTAYAWFVSMDNGYVSYLRKDNYFCVWSVRSVK